MGISIFVAKCLLISFGTSTHQYLYLRTLHKANTEAFSLPQSAKLYPHPRNV